MTLSFFAPQLLLSVVVLAYGIGAASAVPQDLTKDSFDGALGARPDDSWAVIEFFAAWCPACQHFAPTYEEAAECIGNSTQRDSIWVARVDCATEIDLCNRFKVQGYPNILVGKPASFAEGAKPQPHRHGGGFGSAEDVLNWVAEETGRSIDSSADDHSAAALQAPDSLADGPKRTVTAAQRGLTSVDLTDVMSATIAAFRSTVDNPAIMKGVEARQALKDFLDLLATAHPMKECRTGAEAAERVLAKAWPEPEQPPKKGAFANTYICGRSLSQQDWGSCRGSSPGSRGYTCGLWLLFHTLASHVTGNTGGTLWLTAVKGFMDQFFPCDECSRHFVDMASEDDALMLRKPDDALLWSWRAHNRVNVRVAKDEQDNGYGDPAFPKVQWPAPEECPACRTQDPAGGAAGDGWDEIAVLTFLHKFYAAADGLPQRGRWHMQMHRKSAFARSRRFSGRMFHGQRSTLASVLFWVFVVGGILLVVSKSLQGSGNSVQRSGNGKFRHQ